MKFCSFFIIMALFLTGCSVPHNPAPIQYNHKNTQNKTILHNDYVESLDQNAKIVHNENGDEYILPTAHPMENNKKFIYHEVQIGETIKDIAEKYEVSVDEIASCNNLYPPYELEELQIIKVKIIKKIQPDITIQKPNIISKEENIEITKQAPIFSVDYIKPVDGRIISKFGEKTDYGPNKGINISAKNGTKVLATATGSVIYASYDGTFGNLVIIKLSDKNIITSYAHLEDLVISKGASIKQGDIVGYVGSTGKVKSPQLHFAVREGKIAKDPLKYVKY